MAYPFWDTGLAYGPLMAVIGVVHVFISHFAIGGGLYLVVAEWLARRRQDEQALEFLVRLSRFFVLVTLVGGALTGVGIWFIVGLLNPAATELLIRNFVWVWAIEWTFFVVEITAALVYYYGWHSLPARRHLAVGWVYFAAAWASLFAINGIVTFMLTPGEWSATADLAAGFFNPSFWPSLLARSAFSLTLAGLYVLAVLAVRAEQPLRARAGRRAALLGLAALAVAAAALWWYFATVPEATRQLVRLQMRIPAQAMTVLIAAAGVTALLLLLVAALPRLLHWSLAGLVMLGGLLTFGGAEWLREAARKPWAVPGTVYATGIAAADLESLQEGGLLAQLDFRSKDSGADVFRRACASCHTLHGYRALAPALAGMKRDFIAGLARGADAVSAAMPPFPGNGEDAAALAGYLVKHLPAPDTPYPKVAEQKLPRAVYQRHCGLCHEPGGKRDIAETFSGMEADEVEEFLEGAGEVDERMPPFTGSAAESGALVKYLLELGHAAGGDS